MVTEAIVFKKGGFFFFYNFTFTIILWSNLNQTSAEQEKPKFKVINIGGGLKSKFQFNIISMIQDFSNKKKYS